MTVRLEPIKRSTLTVSETATYLGVSNDTIYKLCRDGAIVHFRIGSRILFKKGKIDEWVDSQMITGTEVTFPI